MSQLSKNLKVIRNHLKLTQFEFSKTLGIGFRTYVRYEMGERETPISVLVKVSKLIKVSLDDLILSPFLINEFANLENEQLILSQKDEKKLLNLYRKMDFQTREQCLIEMKLLIKNSAFAKNKSVNLSKNHSAKKIAKLKKSSNLPKRVGEKN